MPKYNLTDVFADQPNVNYKIDCKYDFYFDGEEIEHTGVGVKIATRTRDQWSLEEKKANLLAERELVHLDKLEMRREKIWQLLCNNLFEFPISPKEFIKQKFRKHFCKPKYRMQGVANADISTERSKNKMAQTKYGQVRMP